MDYFFESTVCVRSVELKKLLRRIDTDHHFRCGIRDVDPSIELLKFWHTLTLGASEAVVP
jgi:hypothetical protein